MTVRHGRKWNISIGAKLSIRTRPDTHLNYGFVIFKRYLSITNIPRTWLKFEHNQTDLLGLVRKLDEFYPDGWGPYVTCLFLITDP
jgi:hypothetical protein